MKPGLCMTLILIAAPCLAETTTGVTHLSDTIDQGRPLALSVWYPSDGPTSTVIGGNAVFEGVAAAPDAPLPQGPLPLVVMSHGGLRSAADSGAWLGAALAQAGLVVAEVNAPHPADAVAALDEIWRRPQDIGRALGLMLNNPAWAGRIDPDRIAAVGFALGATAALSVAGADLDADRYTRSCAAGNGIETPDCGWYAAQGVSLAQTDRAALARQWRDPRFGAAIAMEPEYPAALHMTPADTAIMLIGLGNPAVLPPGIRPGQSIAIPDATPFDAFDACTEAGPEILLEEAGDAAICGTDPEAREQAHRKIAGAIAAFLMPKGE